MSDPAGIDGTYVISLYVIMTALFGVSLYLFVERCKEHLDARRGV